VEAKLRHKRVKKQFGHVIDRIKILNRLGAHWNSMSDSSNWTRSDFNDDNMQNNSSIEKMGDGNQSTISPGASPVAYPQDSEGARWESGDEEFRAFKKQSTADLQLATNPKPGNTKKVDKEYEEDDDFGEEEEEEEDTDDY